MARRKAQILWRPRLFWNRGGRLAARHMRIRSDLPPPTEAGFAKAGAIAHRKCAKAPNPSACFFAVICRSPGCAFAWVRISISRSSRPEAGSAIKITAAARHQARKAPARLHSASEPKAGAQNPRSNRPKAGSATNKSSASSWRGLVVDPGGAPAPPECRLNVKPARRAPPPV
jgi:hypothetical protein